MWCSAEPEIALFGALCLCNIVVMLQSRFTCAVILSCRRPCRKSILRHYAISKAPAIQVHLLTGRVFGDPNGKLGELGCRFPWAGHVR